MTVLFAIILFSVLVFVHELGHFAFAKLFGIQVNEFALFMGPAIFKKQIGETLYSIRCIPVGGFCAMEGEDEDSDNPRAFHRAVWWKRMIVLVAGAAMNFITGVLLFAVVFAPMEQAVVPVIDFFEEGCTLQGENGLQPGDRLLEVDGKRVYTASSFTTLLSLNPGDVHDVLVERSGEKILLDDFHLVMAEFPDGNGGTSLRYGFSFRVEDLNLAAKLRYVWNDTMDNVRIVWLSLQMLLKGQAGLMDMAGPVGIVHMMSESAAAAPTALDALYNLLYFGGFLAVNLAVVNLLPFPALDGGRVVCLLLTAAVEAVIRKKIDPKYEGYLHTAGLCLLLALIIVIMFKDIFVIFKG